MSNTIDNQLLILEGTKAQIKQALIDKNINISDNDSFRSYADKIDTYTEDATVVAEDIEKGKIAYAKGEKVIGSLETLGKASQAFMEALSITDYAGTNTTKIRLTVPYLEDKKIIKAPLQIFVDMDKILVASQLGITPEKIVEGNTILGVQGTGKTSEDLEEQLNAQDEIIASQAAIIAQLKSLLSDKASNITTETITAVNEILGNEEV